MNLEGRIVRLRAPEPADIDLMYAWENDPEIWAVSGTTEPFSREQMRRFVERQSDGGDLLRTGQLRLIVETRPVASKTGNTKRPAALYGSETDEPEHMVDRGTPRPVGAIDLFEYDPIHRRAGIGILIYGMCDRGRGYASDAVETLCRYTRDTLGMHQLWCNVGAENAASLRLFRNLGFAEIGIKRDWQWRPDGYRDEILLQKILE